MSDFTEASVGDALPAEQIELTPTFVIKTAMASRDFEEVHHDVEVARSKGLDNIFLNILTTNGICQRVVTSWAGPTCEVRRATVRLGVPALAGTKMDVTATVVDVREDGEIDVEVVGMVPAGLHCKAVITIALAPSANGVAA